MATEMIFDSQFVFDKFYCKKLYRFWSWKTWPKKNPLWYRNLDHLTSFLLCGCLVELNFIWFSIKILSKYFSSEINLNWVGKLFGMMEIHGNSIHVDKTLIESRKFSTWSIHRSNFPGTGWKITFPHISIIYLHQFVMIAIAAIEKNLSRVAAREIGNILTRTFALTNAI